MRLLRATKSVFVLMLCALTLAAAHAATPQTAAFSYQGRLDAAGAAANGTYQFTFALFDAATGGNAVGAPLAQTIQVIDGVFTTDLDFGRDLFAGQQRWLEISVGSTLGNEQVLASRQPIQAVPVAQFALNSPKHVIFAADATANSASLTVGQYSYSSSCKVTGSGSNISVIAALSLLPLAGQTFNIYGIERAQTKDMGAFTDTAHNFTAQTAPFAFAYTRTASVTQRYSVTDTVVDDAGALQTVSMRISLNSSAVVPPHDNRCMIEAVITPTS